MNLVLALQTVVDDDDGYNVGIGSGGLVGLLFVILLIVVIFYFIRRV